MTSSEFIDRLCAWARTGLVAKCTQPMTMLAIGAASCGVGRKILEAKLSPFLAMCADESGAVDVEGLKESALAGLDLAKSVPILGGLVSVDAQDARDFFATLPA